MSGDDATKELTDGAGDDGAGDDGDVQEEMMQQTNDSGNEEEEAPVAAAKPLVSNRVFVGNLAWNTSWQNLKDHMRDAGDVVYADIFYERRSGPHHQPGRRPRSKGCGVVEYESVEDAQNAINTLNETELDGRKIFIQPDKKPDFPISRPGPRPRRGFPNKRRNFRDNRRPMGGGPGGRTGPPRNQRRQDRGGSECKVYVGNLNYTTSWQTLKDHMRKAGDVQFVDIFEDQSRRSKGCALVEFGTKEDALKAIDQLDGTRLDGRPIFLREDRPKNKRPFKQNTNYSDKSDDDVDDEEGSQASGDLDARSDGSSPSVKNTGAGDDADAQSQAKDEDEEATPGRPIRIFMGNLDFGVNNEDLKEHLKGYEYQSADIQLNKTKTDVFRRRSRGFAIVTVETEEQRKRIIKDFNDTEKGKLMGRYMEVRNNREHSKSNQTYSSKYT